MKVWSVALTLLVALALMLGSSAAEEKAAAKGKEVTLTGKLVCGKCTLMETDSCSNVLQVTKDDKTVNYYLDDGAKKAKYHGGICPPGSTKNATVTGVVSTKDGKMVLTPSKVDVK